MNANKRGKNKRCVQRLNDTDSTLPLDIAPEQRAGKTRKAAIRGGLAD
jgi:hypothetical protein